MPFIEFTNVRKTYQVGEVKTHALANTSFVIEKGEICVIVGQSGAGKTTLLNILGGMDTLTEGTVMLDQVEVSALSKKQLATYRRNDIGFVFQFYNLIPNLTALENVEIATQLGRNPLDPATVLRDVGLGNRMDNFPAQLSGGEQQRVAIARALAKNPKLLLCDEPTGALDHHTGKTILELLEYMSIRNNITVVIVTHNLALTAMADRVIRMDSGMIKEMYQNTSIVPIGKIEW